MQDCGRELLPVKILNRTDTFTAVFVKLAILRKGRSANVAVNLSAAVGRFPVSHGAHYTSVKCHCFWNFDVILSLPCSSKTVC